THRVLRLGQRIKACARGSDGLELGGRDGQPVTFSDSHRPACRLFALALNAYELVASLLPLLKRRSIADQGGFNFTNGSSLKGFELGGGFLALGHRNCDRSLLAGEDRARLQRDVQHVSLTPFPETPR